MEQELQDILSIPNNIVKRIKIQELINKYPAWYELYYVMGHMYTEKEYTYALEWFLKCFDKLPNYVENILDILKIYYDNYHVSVILNFIGTKMPSDIDHPIYQDGRIFITVGTAYLRNHDNLTAKKYLVLAHERMENALNKDMLQYACLCNSVGKLHLDHHEYKKAFEYYYKVIDLFLKNKIQDKEIFTTSLGNILLAKLYQLKL